MLAGQALARNMESYNGVKIRALDKVTARSETLDLNIGDVLSFGSLEISVEACRKTPPIEQPESAAFLKILDYPIDQKTSTKKEAVTAFSGWMFASSPGLSSMDHPIYDIWVLDCIGESTGSGDDALLDFESTPQFQNEPPSTDTVEEQPADAEPSLFDLLQTEILSEDIPFSP